ncbi:MAG: PorP/SprF family type IX secretion system membrane protein [Saprospiraceae bacterium]|jgi:type IX secretion system PorP/SprF family membrane protein|nr:PorP/SprF family type IX secretion system membrane protein [Saprospiraceae bacterium]
MKLFTKISLFAKSLVILGWLASPVQVQAQDIHFSQFYMAPLYLNPALTGIMNCTHRITGNYRNQWASILRSNAYNTYNVSYDQRIAVGRRDYLGVGANFYGDVAGSADFSTVKFMGSVSYSKQMSGTRNSGHYLVAGADLGIVQRGLDFNALQWGTQHNGDGQHDPTRPSFENFDRSNFFYPDLSAGLLWFSVFDANNNLYFGGAFHHINRANVSFNENRTELMYSKFTIHAGGEFELTRRFALVPGIVTFLQGPSLEINGGTSFKFNLGNQRLYQAFMFGTWVRLANKLDKGILADAMILSTRFEYDRFGVGFSYDLNISSLSNASNNQGGFELAAFYKICGPERRGVYCPSF